MTELLSADNSHVRGFGDVSYYRILTIRWRDVTGFLLRTAILYSSLQWQFIPQLNQQFWKNFSSKAQLSKIHHTESNVKMRRPDFIGSSWKRPNGLKRYEAFFIKQPQWIVIALFQFAWYPFHPKIAAKLECNILGWWAICNEGLPIIFSRGIARQIGCNLQLSSLPPTPA